MLPHISFPVFIFFVIIALLYTGGKVDPFAASVAMVLGFLACCFFGMFLGLTISDVLRFVNWVN